MSTSWNRNNTTMMTTTKRTKVVEEEPNNCNNQQQMPTTATKLRGYLQVKQNPTTRRSRLPRKAWRRQWMVLDIVETLASPALIGRIYNSHMHEDRTLPSSTVTLTDVHGIHRAQSRSHPFAFSLDGGCQCLILSGNSETETQQWMRQIRDLLWPRVTTIWLRTENSFEVSLIDNVHSDIARLRGFYGQLVVEGREILLVEARSGAGQIRWPIKSLKKWFCPKVAAREDRDKIIVIITHKSCSSGEGIFTFYCRRARELVARLTASSKNQPMSSIEGKKFSSSHKMNPLLALLRRGSNNSRTYNNKKQVSAAAALGKSASSAEHLDKTGGFEVGGGGVAAPKALLLSKTLGRGLSLDRSYDNNPPADKKKSASESNLLNPLSNLVSAQSTEGIIEGGQHHHNTDLLSNLPAPPPEEELQRMSISATLETVTGGEGFYRSFDDLDDIDDHLNLMGVLADSNPLEAAVVLRGSENLSQSGTGSNGGRNSFNSSDSGRMSDTYAETSNSSVASSSNGHNRLHSNMSNCSGDSGAQLSVNSNDSSKVLGVLKEQESPDFPPFDQEIYGRSVSIKSDTKPSNNISESTSTMAGIQQEENNPMQPRFATVRKSFTMSHVMERAASAAGSASMASTPTVLSPRKRKDLSQFLGLNDEGPGSPSKDVVQTVAMQNLPAENSNEKIEKFLGINQGGALPAAAAAASHDQQQSKRPRPKSLHGLDRSQSIDHQDRPKIISPNLPYGQAPLSKTLARLQKIKDSAKSAPTTPNVTTSTESSPSKKALKLFGLGTSNSNKIQGGLLKTQSSLSTSTPMDLESKSNKNHPEITLTPTTSEMKHDRSWQSNEGLTTSGSGGVPTPMEPMSPAIKRIMPHHGLVLRVASSSSPDDHYNNSTNSASNSPFHASLGRGGITSRPLPSAATSGCATTTPYNTSSLQRGGLGTITKSRGGPPQQYHPRKLPRSATLDDLEPYYEPVMWVQRCHPCCCNQYNPAARIPHTPAMEHGSLPRYPGHHHGSMPRRPLPPVRQYEPQQQQQQLHPATAAAPPEPMYLSMNRRKVVVIPINGGGSTTSGGPGSSGTPTTTPSKVVPIGNLRESSVDLDNYHNNAGSTGGTNNVVPLDAGSKVLSMGNKTCISVNESNMVSTKAIVHHQ